MAIPSKVLPEKDRIRLIAFFAIFFIASEKSIIVLQSSNHIGDFMKLPDDPIILELLPEFIETWIGELNGQFIALVRSRNESEMYRMGHTIKGSCAQFGLDEISAMGIELMGYARAQEWEKVLAIREKILRSFIHAQKYIQSL